MRTRVPLVGAPVPRSPRFLRARAGAQRIDPQQLPGTADAVARDLLFGIGPLGSMNPSSATWRYRPREVKELR